jgi:hypothetical protein
MTDVAIAGGHRDEFVAAMMSKSCTELTMKAASKEAIRMGLRWVLRPLDSRKLMDGKRWFCAR